MTDLLTFNFCPHDADPTYNGRWCGICNPALGGDSNGKELSMDDWKVKHADDAEAVLDVPEMHRVMEEFADNMRFEFSGLPRYGLMKVVSYAAQIARAQALGFDPALLRLRPEEANEQLLKKARMAVAAGKPVWAIDADDGTVTRLD